MCCILAIACLAIDLHMVANGKQCTAAESVSLCLHLGNATLHSLDIGEPLLPTGLRAKQHCTTNVRASFVDSSSAVGAIADEAPAAIADQTMYLEKTVAQHVMMDL